MVGLEEADLAFFGHHLFYLEYPQGFDFVGFEIAAGIDNLD